MDYPNRLRSGDAVLDRLVLNGWGAVTANVTSLYTWTDYGRLWWVFTQSSGDLSFYRRKTAGSGDKVCSGTVSSGLVTLAQANSSGISGTAELTNGDYSGSLSNPTQNSTGDVILSYADENDLRNVAKGFPNILDSNSKFEGQLARFEALLLQSRLEFDGWLAQKLSGAVTVDPRGRPVLCDIQKPRQLAYAHALYALGWAARNRAGLDKQRWDMAQAILGASKDALDSLVVDVDTDADRKTDGRQSFTTGYLVR